MDIIDANILPLVLGLRDSAPILWRVVVGESLATYFLEDVGVEKNVKNNIGIRIEASSTVTDVVASLSIAAVSFAVAAYTNPSSKLWAVSIILFVGIVSIVVYGYSQRVKRSPSNISRHSNLIYFLMVVFLILLEKIATYIK